MKCPLCGRDMEVIGYISLIGERGGQSRKVPARWKRSHCGVVIDAT